LTPPVGILLYICGNFAGVKIERVVLWLPNLMLK